MNGFAGALPLPALLSGDASLTPYPVILSTAKDLALLAFQPSHSEPFIVIPGLTRNLLPVMPSSDRASPNP